jgi:hypothetical protein
MENPHTNQQIVSSKKTVFAAAGILLFLLLLVLTLYTTMHEGGHALVGMILGGKITSFNVNFFNLSAHAGIQGNFTQGQQALISIAGISLPLLLSTVFIFFSHGKKEPVFEWFKLILFLGTVNSLLAWITIPLLVMAGKTISDDSANFLRYTGLQPWLVTLLALLLYIALWAFFLRRSGGFQALIYRVRNYRFSFSHTETRQTLLSLGILAAICLTTVISLTRVFPAPTFDVPPGYQLVNELHLFENSYTNQPVYRFTLTEPASVSLYILLENVKGAPTSIHLSGPMGFDQDLFTEQDPQADIGMASVNPHNMLLQKGDYEILATLQPSPGSVRIYIGVN